MGAREIYSIKRFSEFRYIKSSNYLNNLNSKQNLSTPVFFNFCTILTYQLNNTFNFSSNPIFRILNEKHYNITAIFNVLNDKLNYLGFQFVRQAFLFPGQTF